jgi:glyoxylase-like metal-dependent hydrolase (beta-lactamase superfamily II)
MTEPVQESRTQPRRRRPTKWALLGAAVAVFAGVAWLGPRGFSPRPARLSPLLLPEPVAVAPGVYLLGKTSPAAAYLVETSAGLVLIDSGLESDAAAVTEQVAGLGFDVRRLRAVLLTHVHGDHSLGAEHLRTLTGAKIYAGRDDCPSLRAGGPREAFFSTHSMPQVVLHPTTVDVVLSGDETLDFGETHFVALAAPGHTGGSVCYLLERPGLRALFTGDVIQHLGPGGGRGDLGTYTAYLPAAYGGDARAYLASLRRLRELPPPDLVLPGHPQMDALPEPPRLGAVRWRALLDQGIAELERLLARYKADGAAFLDGNPKELLPGLHYLGDCAGTPVYCLAALDLEQPAATGRTRLRGLFLFDAPGGVALVDFLARRFAELGWKGRKPAAVLLTAAGGEGTAGLTPLVRDSGCAVVAPKEGLEEVRRLCPAGTRVLPEDEPGKSGWFEVRAVPLGGTGPAAVAYRLRWAGKTVLVSGRIPVRLTDATVEKLLREVTGPGGSAEQYRAALGRLAEASPDLWLTAVPLHGQNAFVYDDDWARLLGQHRQLMGMVR